MNEKRFSGDITRLRSPDRVARLEVERVVSHCLEGAEIRSILDVGTGTGLFAEAFAGRGLKVTGVDINPMMIAAVPAYVPGGEFRLAAAEALPYGEAAFDLVFMGLLLHESDEQLQVLVEAQQVTRLRVGILEWAFREEDVGPPLADRVEPDLLIAMAHEVGFRKVEVLPLTTLVLYRLAL
jgi:ubiquinone/menaquinone biosynthesis C-methylase UbiE